MIEPNPNEQENNPVSRESKNVFNDNPHLKRLLLVFIVILVISGIGLSVFSYVSKQYRSKIYLETQQAISKTQKASLTAQTETWKTYYNTEYAYQFDYPSSVAVGDKKVSISLGTAQNPVYGITIGGGVLVPLTTPGLESQASNIMAQISSNTASKEASNDAPAPPTCEKQDIKSFSPKITGIYCTGEGGPAYYVYISGGPIDLFFDGYAGKTMDNGTANKIFSSFRFVDQTTKVWKTYRNEEYGFEIQYPSDWENDPVGEKTGNYFLLLKVHKVSTTQNYPSAEDPIDAALEVGILQNPKNLSLQEIFNDNEKACEQEEAQNPGLGCPGVEQVMDWQHLTITNRNALRSGVRSGPFLDRDSLYIQEKGYFIQIDGVFYNEDTYNYAPTLDKILSTFKFTK